MDEKAGGSGSERWGLPGLLTGDSEVKGDLGSKDESASDSRSWGDKGLAGLCSGAASACRWDFCADAALSDLCSSTGPVHGLAITEVGSSSKGWDAL